MYTLDKGPNTVIAMGERLDSIDRSPGAYRQECYDKLPKESTQKKPEPKSNKKLKYNGKSSNKEKQREKPASINCGGEGHMVKDCLKKKNKGKAKVKKEATSKVGTELSESDEVYIYTLESRAMQLQRQLAPRQSRRTPQLKPPCSLMERKRGSFLIQEQ